MASSNGHLLVAKTMRLIRYGVEKAGRAVRDSLGRAGQVEARTERQTERLYARIDETPVSRVQAWRQGQTRSFSTHRVVNRAVRYFSNEVNAATRPLRSSYPQSRTRNAVSQLTSRTPFASTLRPNLTGGTLSRTSGGYGTGAGRVNGVRYFSHSPSQAAEVVQNVSQAVRAFWISGQRAHFDGYHPRSGNKRFRALSPVQDKARHAFDISNTNSAGSFVDFKINPTITAVGPLSTIPKASSYTDSYNDDCVASYSAEHATTSTITDPTIMTTLAIDFARALKELAAIMNDLKRLATLGDLPLILLNPTTLRVRFPGCDAGTVESLCQELNVRRGIVGQDEDFEAKHGAEMALLFPFAPSKSASEADYYDGHQPAKRTKRDNIDWHGMLSPAVHARHGVPQSLSGESYELDFDMPSPRRQKQGQQIMGFMSPEGEIVDNAWLNSQHKSAAMSDYSSLRPSDGLVEDNVETYFTPNHRQLPETRSLKRSRYEEYEGLEGIYKFIEQCDRAKR